ncbi:hypothetical protein [Gudongella sp. DL1XJH-153]|uniref:hypothetical protein n=1 Tax=Gudongella sp. DL1XJH-153 TaxID=3409804 RepID=UPI003BB6D99B
MKKTLSLFMVVLMILSTSIVFAEPAPPNWDISGTWSLILNNTYEREFRNLIQDEEGKVTGEFFYLTDDGWEEGGTLEGYVSGDKVYLYYERPAQYNYSGDFTGEIDWSGMSGEFKDSSGTEYSWVTTYGEPELLWDARVSGGGQMMADSGEESAKNGKPIFYKISFGGGSYVSNRDLYFDGLEVTFHNVSDPEVKGGKFVGDELVEMDFRFNEGVAKYTVNGTFNGDPGYSMIVRVEDFGEPSFGFEDTEEQEFYADNLRFVLKGEISYDSSNDFPGESDNDGKARNFLDRGNIQVDDLAGYGIIR